MEDIFVERARAAIERAEQEWATKQEHNREYLRALRRKKQPQPVVLYDKAKKGDDDAAKGIINDWQYIGVPGKRQVQGFVTDHPSGQEGSIVTAPIIEYDHVTGTITTKSGNRYRLGTPNIVD